MTPSPGGYPADAITTQKRSARTSVATIVIAAASGIESAKKPRESTLASTRADARRDHPRRPGLGRERVFAEPGDQTVERRLATRRRESHTKRRRPTPSSARRCGPRGSERPSLARRSRRPARPPRRTRPVRRTARRAAYCETTTTRSRAPKSTDGVQDRRLIERRIAALDRRYRTDRHAGVERSAFPGNDDVADAQRRVLRNVLDDDARRYCRARSPTSGRACTTAGMRLV